MFAPLILPFLLTALTVALVSLVAVGILPMYGYSIRKTVVSTFCVSVILFIPFCVGISTIVDSLRYGTFSYRSAAEIRDPYVELPASATKITLVKYATGHFARFTAANDKIVEWLAMKNAKKDDSPVALSTALPKGIGQMGWPLYEVARLYRGPRTAWGGGFNVLYSPQQENAYLSADYW